jgi:hypothetical protein
VVHVPRESQAYPSAAGREHHENFGPNFGPITPKHDGKPWNSRYQRASKDGSIHNPRKSAKPPSPVQIRAAPPILPAENIKLFEEFCGWCDWGLLRTTQNYGA